MSLRWAAPDVESLRRILADPPRTAWSLSAGAPRSIYYREIYLDTSERELQQRRARCRIRFAADGRRSLTVWLPDGERLETWIREADTMAALAGAYEPALRLRALTEIKRLSIWFERDVDRACRTLRLPLLFLPVCDLIADTITLRRGEVITRSCEVALRAPVWGRPLVGRIGLALESTAMLRRAGADAVLRAMAALDAAEAEGHARELRGEREVVLVALEHGRLGLCRHGAELRLPTTAGSGEAACRSALRDLAGSGEGQLRLLGIVPPTGDRAAIEVWAARQLHRNSGSSARTSVQWFAPADLLARVGSPVLRDSRTLAALTVAARSPLLPEWSGAALSDESSADAAPVGVARDSRVTLTDLRTPLLSGPAVDPERLAPEQFLNAEISTVEFNARVLALAEDAQTPPAARLRFLAIVSTNLDHFVRTQLSALKQLVAAGRAGPAPADAGGLRAQETLDAVAVRLRPLVARQYRALDALLRERHGVTLVRDLGAAELTAAEQQQLRTRFADELLPFLNPKALTRAPGHPFPVVRDGRLTLLVALRDRPDATVHYALVEMPDAEIVPPFMLLSGDRVLPVENMVRANLDLLYPGRIIAAAHAFRLTRSGDLQLDETGTANFLQAIEEELVRRQLRPVVRVQIETGTPTALQNLLQRELRFEESERESTLTPADVYLADGPVDLGGLQELEIPGLADYPALTPRDPFDGDRPIADQLDVRDVLVYHPYDSFATSVERFIGEAADDSDVQSIKLTLYRLGGSTPIADALRRAAATGKDVSVIVELKARFDEARNIAWARSLERDGIHVVTGLVSLKTHAKLALVVRRTARGSRRYAHIGTGNYNPETAAVYTDCGLFTADPRITGDVHALFNELTGSSHAPHGGARLPHLLVAPNDLLDRLLALIERETAHARAGRPGRIRAKLNGLADATVIQALYRASQAGVDIDLIVRGICTLRPGVPGLSERIRVVSILGRFLEHARIYQFGDDYYIASADWRPRNLRRRVEVAVPIFDPAARARLDLLLDSEIQSPHAWVLGGDGCYERAAKPPLSAAKTP